MKKLLALSLLVLFTFTACNDEGDDLGADLSAEESKALLKNTVDQMDGDIVSLMESEGVDAGITLIDLLENTDVINGRVSQKEWTKGRLNILAQYFVYGPSGRVSEDEPTSFDDIKGLYEWNEELGDFDKEASDFFIVIFPTEGSETNNAELKISELEFVTVTEVFDDFVDEYEQPSKIEGYLKIDDVTYIELSYVVDWTSEGFPKTADINLFVSPFDFMLGFNDSFGKSTSLITSVKLDGETIVGIDLEVKFETEAKEDPVLFKGNVQYRSLKIDGSIDFRDIGNDGNPNDYIDLALFADGSKVGDIVFRYEEEFEDYVAYVKYADGSLEELELILEPVIEEIESLEDEFFGEDQ